MTTLTLEQKIDDEWLCAQSSVIFKTAFYWVHDNVIMTTGPHAMPLGSANTIVSIVLSMAAFGNVRLARREAYADGEGGLPG